MNAQADISKTNLVKTLSVLHRNFEVSFDVHPMSYAGGWKSVLHMTQGGNMEHYGDRIPGEKRYVPKWVSFFLYDPTRRPQSSNF